MAWAILFLLAVAILVGLLWIARPGRGGTELVAALLLLAVAGYAWQGHPGLPGKPTPPRAGRPRSDSLFASERRIWLDRVGPDGQALDAADGLIAQGDAGYAIGILRAGLSHAPRNMTLWIGLGNALVAYADGVVTPPARYAFDRAAAIAPRHPAPAYLLGLAYAQSGDLDTAEAVWRDQLAHAPADAPWRPLVLRKLAILARIRAAT